MNDITVGWGWFNTQFNLFQYGPDSSNMKSNWASYKEFSYFITSSLNFIENKIHHSE